MNRAHKPLKVLGLAYAFRGNRRERELARRNMPLIELNESLTQRNECLAQNIAYNMARALDLKDEYTAWHSARVAEICRSVAERMDLPTDKVKELHLAGLLHDMGKIGVPTEVLNRDPSELDPGDSAMLQSHTEKGSQILSSAEQFQLWAQVTLQHHERLDGSGYPSGLKGEDIIPEARIAAVAEAVEEMSSPPPSSDEGLGPDEVATRLEAGSGTLYDPIVVDAYLNLVRDGGESFQKRLAMTNFRSQLASLLSEEQ